MGRFDNMKKDWDKPASKPEKASSRTEFELMPEGIYTCDVFNIEERQPRNGGEAFSVTLVVTMGEHCKRRVWDWINFHLPHSSKATEIGRESFRDLCAAAGFADVPPNELSDLIGCELQVRLGVRAANGGYPAKNCVKAYIAHQPAGATADDTDDLF